MRVCIVGPKSCPPEIGGIEVFAFEVGRRLAEKKVDVTVLVPLGPRNRREWTVEGMRVVRVRALRNRFSLKVSMVPDMILAAGRSKPDIFHANDPSSGVVGSLRLRWPKNLLTVHGMGFSRTEWPAPFRQGGTFIQRLAVKGADSVATTDERTASLLRAHRNDVTVIPPGVDNRLFSKGKHSRPAAFEAGKVNIVHIGRLTEVKGTDLLMDSLRLLSAETREMISLKVIGNGPLAPLVEKAARSSPAIQWLGEIPHDMIAPYFANADMFVMPSRSEGLPISMLEAMSCMVPVVGTVVGGIGTYFDERHITKIPEPTAEAVATALESAVRDKAAAARKAAEAKALIDSRFSWDAVTDQYLKLYEETLA
jgi:glycosyltransferase involved in cell wall biosynthesis